MMADESTSALGCTDESVSLLRPVESTIGLTTHAVESVDDAAAIPFVNGNGSTSGQSSARDTFFHILKGNIGTGLLGLPAAFAFAGLPFAIVGMGLICVLAVHCMFLLAACADHLRRTTGKDNLHYAKVAELAVAGLPGRISKYSLWGKFIVNVFLVITQIGLCCVYVLFVAENIKQVLEACGVTVSIGVLIALSMVVFVPGSYVRELKHLAPLSGVATLVQVLSILVILGYLGSHMHVDETQIAPFKPALFFGVAVFSLEGICLVLPLENDIREKKLFAPTLCAGMVVTCSLYMVMGILGMLAYHQPRGSITLDLPAEGQPENLPYIFVRLFYAFSIVATYFIQFFVPMAIMQRRVVKILGQRLEKFTPYIMRTGFVAITAVVAVVVPKLDLAISLVGAFSSSTLALIFPPLLELAVFRHQITKWMLLKDIFISSVGLFGMVVGTYTTIEALAKHGT